MAFFYWTGSKFRPMNNNPYLPLRMNDDDDDNEGEDGMNEFGLDDNETGDVEMPARSSKRRVLTTLHEADEDDDDADGTVGTGDQKITLSV